MLNARTIVEKCGGSALVARRTDTPKGTVYRWMHRGTIPEAGAWRILHAFGEGVVSRADLGLPDIHAA